MVRSIQDSAKKINSNLTFIDCVAVLMIFTATLLFFIFVKSERKKTSQPLTYVVSHEEGAIASYSASQPFGSRSGTTYTYSWCGGASRTKPENRIYFKNKEEAEKAGRRLSKLCS